MELGNLTTVNKDRNLLSLSRAAFFRTMELKSLVNIFLVADVMFWYLFADSSCTLSWPFSILEITLGFNVFSGLSLLSGLDLIIFLIFFFTNDLNLIIL